jgi:hypothetical protein
VKLPGNPKLGEGKPENQNHAIIFTRGNAVQTIDMNQVIADFTVDMNKYCIVFYCIPYLCISPLIVFNLTCRKSILIYLSYE